MGRLRSLAAPARPLRLGGIPSQSPFQGGCRGTECCPFFCSICRPQSGRVGNETMPFSSASGMSQIRNICVTSENALKLIKIGPCSASVGCDEAGTTLKSSELVAREQPKTGHVQTSLKPGNPNKPQRTLRSSELRSKTGHCHNSSNLTNADSVTTGRSEAPNSWPGSTPCTGA